MSDITLRIVGTFYHRSDIPFEDGITVEGVLNYARANDTPAPPMGAVNPTPQGTKFNYIANPDGITDGPSIIAFAAKYKEKFRSLTSGQLYDAGEYFLSESTVMNPRYSVWQYYVFDASGDLILQQPRIKSYTKAEVPKGGAVLWRLVEILSAPNPVPTVYRQSLFPD